MEHPNYTHFMSLKCKFLVLLLLRVIGILDDGLFTVNFELFKLVAQHSFDRLAVIGTTDLFDRSRYRVRL